MDPKKTVIALAFLITVGASLAWPAGAHASYKSVLKKWTRTGKVYVVDNFEARMIWNATYLSGDFRAARRERLSELLEWSDAELLQKVREDGEESAEFDVFFLSVYAGSSVWSDVGKDDGQWRIFLESGDGPAVEPAELELIPVNQIQREVFPYLDKWSHAYYARFPKRIRPGEPFRIRMAGIPAKSELVWK